MHSHLNAQLAEQHRHDLLADARKQRLARVARRRGREPLMDTTTGSPRRRARVGQRAWRLAALFVIALVALPVLVGGPEAEAQVPGANGKIAFESDRDGDDEIYVMNPDGTGVEQLTDNDADDRRPAWSPDGTRIAFESRRDGNWDVYVMDDQGNNQTPLTDDVDNDRSPAWSPDGNRIAFESNRDGNREIYVMDDQGNNQDRLTTHADSDFGPAWSPDGTRIAFSSGNIDVYVMDDQGNNQDRLTIDAVTDSAPAWSPDGTRIAFSSLRDGDWEVYVMDDQGGNQARLTTDAATDFNPAWSPDGTRIAFDSLDSLDDNTNVYVMDDEGGNQTPLTTDAADDASPAWQPVAPSVEPDEFASVSRTETFAGSVVGNDQPGDWAVEMVDAPSAGEVELASDGSFIYRLDDPFTLADSDTFTYRACPNQVLCSEPTTVSLELEQFQTDLVADSVVCDREESCEVDVVANDFPTDLLSLDEVEAVGDPHGVFFSDDDGGFEFTPSADHPGGDTEFSYTATVPTAAGGQATVPGEGTITATVRHETGMEVTVDPDKPTEDDDITLTATLTGPDSAGQEPAGIVEFLDGGQSLGTAELASPASLTVGDLAEGDHEITAVYTGDDRFAPVASDPVTLAVAAGTAPEDDPDDDQTDNNDTASDTSAQAPTSPAAAPTPASSTGNGELAFTGADYLTLAAVAAGLLAAGAMFAAYGHRRRMATRR